MPLFSRLSEQKQRTKSKSRRFSLRMLHRQSDSDADVESNHFDRKVWGSRESDQGHDLACSTLTGPTFPRSKSPCDVLSHSFRSSASTTRSTIVTVPDNLNDTIISTGSFNRDSIDRGASDSSPRDLSVCSSRPSASTEETMSRSKRNSLAEYSQLQCSMSYKNRVNNEIYRGTSLTFNSRDSKRSERMSDTRASLVETVRVTNSSLHSTDGHSLLNARISESSPDLSSAVASSSSLHRSSLASPLSRCTSRFSEVSTSSAFTKMTEASIIALQARRALQQMVLAVDDDDSCDELDSDSEAWPSSSAASSSSEVVRVGADEYKKFQFRLRQLEELTAEQARKQQDMENIIESEVQTRTQKVVDAMEKKISIYKQAKELEFEQEVQRRVSVQLENPRMSRCSSVANTAHSASLYGLPSVDNFRDISGSEGNSLEKLLHPRRSRKRLEQMKQREEALKRELEQFREIIRTTEMRLTQTQGVDGVMSTVELEKAKTMLEDVADPLLPVSLLQSSPSELIEMICMLHKNGQQQEKQIAKTKNLLNIAIEAREDAESTAREAMELALMLDGKIDGEAGEKQALTQCNSPIEGKFRHEYKSSGISSESSSWRPSTPKSSSILDD